MGAAQRDSSAGQARDAATDGGALRQGRRREARARGLRVRHLHGASGSHHGVAPRLAAVARNAPAHRLFAYPAHGAQRTRRPGLRPCAARLRRPPARPGGATAPKPRPISANAIPRAPASLCRVGRSMCLSEESLRSASLNVAARAPRGSARRGGLRPGRRSSCRRGKRRPKKNRERRAGAPATNRNDCQVSFGPAP